FLSGGPSSFPASPKFAHKSPESLALRGFLLPSSPTVAQYKPDLLGVSMSIATCFATGSGDKQRNKTCNGHSQAQSA
ncbi:hypothetical protein, partial [Paraburkholderia fungorum]|uniref:hypothetical protein n=1 Tax=Paraburkholderia fungorum TaxID=134537 RepID=UPI001C4A6BD8